MKRNTSILYIVGVALALGACVAEPSPVADSDEAIASTEQALTCAAGPTAPLNKSIQNGLIALYRFDECTGSVTHESTGLGTNGTLYNFPGDDSQWVDGKLGSGLYFRGPGTMDHVIAPNYIKPTSSMTVSAWVWADSRPAWATIVKNWGGSQTGQFHFGLTAGSGEVGVPFDLFSSNATEPSAMPTGSWQHVAFVADAAAQTLTIYRNGVISAGPTFYDGSMAAPPMAALGIGVKTNNAGTAADISYPGYWHGILDDLALWNRALTAQEIARIYQSGEDGVAVGEIDDPSPCDDPSTATILGTAGDDYLVGTPGDDIIFGLDGNDVIDGLGGNDILCGGPGLDAVIGGDGDDYIDGGADYNWLRGGNGDDTVYGGNDGNEIQGNAGNDTLQGGDGADTIYCGPGNDVAHGGAGDDDMLGNEDDDILFGDAGNDWMLGGTGNDTLDGGVGDDRLFGEDGDDNLIGGDGVDRINCGLGIDSYSEGEWDFDGCEIVSGSGGGGSGGGNTAGPVGL